MINEKIAWLEENADADADEMKAQKKEMEDIVQPIIAKLYQVKIMNFIWPKTKTLSSTLFKTMSSSFSVLGSRRCPSW